MSNKKAATHACYQTPVQQGHVFRSHEFLCCLYDAPPCSGNIRFLSCPHLSQRIYLLVFYVKHKFFFVANAVM